MLYEAPADLMSRESFAALPLIPLGHASIQQRRGQSRKITQSHALPPRWSDPTLPVSASRMRLNEHRIRLGRTGILILCQWSIAEHEVECEAAADGHLGTVVWLTLSLGGGAEMKLVFVD
jgi:hypothetical protein